jgi:hypothetical protein
VDKAKRSAKAVRKPSGTRGVPLCAAMVLCHHVVIGEDKTATLVRLIDTIGLPVEEARKPGEVGEVGGLTLYISLKRGESSGSFSMILESVDPTGKRTKIGRTKYEAKGEPETGANIMGPCRLAWAGEGLYWLELSTEGGKLVARTPVRIYVGEAEELRRKITARDAAAAPTGQGAG